MQPTCYTLGAAMTALDIRNRRTLEKWMARLAIKPTRHAQDWRFLEITAQEVERIREARAAMPPVRRREARQRPVAPLPLSSLLSPPVPAPALPIARRAAPTRKPVETGLPEGLFLGVHVAEEHGNVPWRTVKNWIDEGKIPVVNERYKLSNGVVSSFVFDRAGMAAFYRVCTQEWRKREKFRPCPQCPHSLEATPHPSGDRGASEEWDS